MAFWVQFAVYIVFYRLLPFRDFLSTLQYRGLLSSFFFIVSLWVPVGTLYAFAIFFFFFFLGFWVQLNVNIFLSSSFLSWLSEFTLVSTSFIFFWCFLFWVHCSVYMFPIFLFSYSWISEYTEVLVVFFFVNPILLVHGFLGAALYLYLLYSSCSWLSGCSFVSISFIFFPFLWVSEWTSTCRFLILFFFSLDFWLHCKEMHPLSSSLWFSESTLLPIVLSSSSLLSLSLSVWQIMN